MSTPTTLNGVSYAIPATGDGGWGTVVSNYLIALSTGTLTKAGGTFTLTAEVNFGATFGIKAPYLKSQGTNPSGTGVLRLANLQAVAWRNNANNADLPLIATASDRLSFNAVVVPTISSTDTLTNKTLDTATNTITNLRDANIASDAAISYGKLSLTGQITDTDLAIGSISYNKLVLTGSVVNADISTSAAIAYSKLALTGKIVNADVGSAAAIAYSKLALTGAVVAGDLAGSIPYSKLILTGAVTNTDLAGGIAYSKLSLTGAIVAADLAGSIPYSKLILTGAVTNADLAAAVSIAKGGTGQTTANAALNALLPNQTTFAGFVLTTDGTSTSWTNPSGLTNPMTSVGDMIVGGASGAAVRLAIGASGTVLKGGTTPSYAQILDADVSASAALSYSKLALTGAILNADLAGSIAYSKLATLTAGNIVLGNGSNVATSTAVTGDVTISNTGVTAIGSSKVTSAMLAGSIAYNKLAALTSANLIIGNSSNIPTVTPVTGDVTISNTGVTAIGASTVTNTMLAGSIAYSKLSLTGAVLNADLAGSIAYSKLVLSNSIVNADVATGAAIDGSKIVAATASVPGVVTTSAQTVAGIKTFNAGIVPGSGQSTLANYVESGTWTPAFDSGVYNIAYTVQVGYYTRIGKMVVATCNLTWTNNTTSGSGTMGIQGFPFPCKTATNLVYVAPCINSNITVSNAGYTSITIELASASSTAVLVQSGTARAANGSALGAVNTTTGVTRMLEFTMIYMVD